MTTLRGITEVCTACAFRASAARLTHGFKPFPRSQEPPKGPYGIRTRAAAVRGRCPRPLDEWAVAVKQCSGAFSTLRSARSDGRRRAWREGGVGVTRVDPLLETPADLLAGRQQVVAGAPRRELHDADGVVAIPVTPCVCRRLVEGPETVDLPAERHKRSLSATVRRGNPGRPAQPALCAGIMPVAQYHGLHDQGLQSRPDRTKYRYAARACARALWPWPKRRRSFTPIWNIPRYWPFCAVVR